jgi:hypothetical protein
VSVLQQSTLNLTVYLLMLGGDDVPADPSGNGLEGEVQYASHEGM